MWRRYFKLVKLVPGKVIVQGYGTLDFAGDIPIETCKALYETDFEFLEITEEGKRALYGIAPLIKNEKLEIKNSEPEPAEGEEAKADEPETPARMNQSGGRNLKPETSNPEPATSNKQPATVKRHTRKKKKEV